jgi:hypothetical protein
MDEGASRGRPGYLLLLTLEAYPKLESVRPKKHPVTQRMEPAPSPRSSWTSSTCMHLIHLSTSPLRIFVLQGLQCRTRACLPLVYRLQCRLLASGLTSSMSHASVLASGESGICSTKAKHMFATVQFGLRPPRRFQAPHTCVSLSGRSVRLLCHQCSSVLLYIFHESSCKECREYSNSTLFQNVLSSRRSGQLFQQASAPLENASCPSSHGLKLVDPVSSFKNSGIITEWLLFHLSSTFLRLHE